MTISGSVARSTPTQPLAASSGPTGRARRRLWSVVDTVGAYVGRRRSPTVPVARLGQSVVVERCPTPLDAAGPVDSGPHPLSVRPCPVDKPAALAHYEAMAAQVAHERRLAELTGPREGVHLGARRPRGVPVASRAPHWNGGAGHG